MAAAGEQRAPPDNSGRTIPVYFFYGDGCAHCEAVKPLLDRLSVQYPNLDIQTLEIYHNATNRQLFVAMQAQYGLKDSGIPVVFVGNSALVGDRQITENIEAAIREAGTGTGSGTRPGIAGNVSVTEITPTLVIGAALIDSVNPCAFAVLIFLLVSIAPLRDRRRVLAAGCCYIAAIFCLYLLSGLGILTVVHISGVTVLLAYVGGFVAIVLGLISVADAIGNRERSLLAIPASRTGQIEAYVKRATLPAAFALGILVGIFELPCVGGMYIAILGLLSSQYPLVAGLPYLILYNVVFVLPLVAILLLVAFGMRPESADAWRLRNRRALRAVVGVAMIVIGVVILAGMVR